MSSNKRNRDRAQAIRNRIPDATPVGLPVFQSSENDPSSQMEGPPAPGELVPAPQLNYQMYQLARFDRISSRYSVYVRELEALAMDVESLVNRHMRSGDEIPEDVQRMQRRLKSIWDMSKE